MQEVLSGQDRDKGDQGAGESRKQAKNRTSQQRYRQRQKEKNESIQQQVQILRRRIASLEIERNSLSERQRLLQRLSQFADKRADSSAFVASSLALQPTDCKVKEEIKADLVSSICGNRPPLVANGDISAAVCDFEALRLMYVENLAGILAKEEFEDLDAYIMKTRKARHRMMREFDLRDDFSQSDNRTALLRARKKPVPFKRSMVTVMGLTEEQKEQFLLARRSFLADYGALRAKRQNSARLLLEGGKRPIEGTKSESCKRLLDNMTANNSFMESLMQEHKCVRSYYITCENLVTPRQEAAAQVEGYLEGMWLDMWIVPNYLEAERGGFLQEWLLENEPRGSCNLHYEMIAVLTSATSASNAYTAEDLNLSGESSAAGSEARVDADILPPFQLRGQEEDLLSFPSLPLEFQGFDAVETVAFEQLFLPSDRTLP